jgi:hypothetical protein
MKTTLCFSALIFAAIIAFSGCKKDDQDNEKPAITLNSPVENEVIIAGTDTSIICLNAECSDNVQLKQYKLNIHNAAGHGHKSSLAGWDTIIIQPLDGKSRIVDLDIDLPHFDQADTAHYHYMVYCLDQAGNESMVYRTIEIKWPEKKQEGNYEDMYYGVVNSHYLL